MIWSILAAAITIIISERCYLDEWGLPLANTSNSRIFHIPSIIPLTHDDQNDFYHDGVYLSEAILYTIKHLNEHVLREPGFCITTSIIDNSMLANKSVSIPLDYYNRMTTNADGSCVPKQNEGALVGFLGAAISDNSIALANLCNVLKIPQISYASTTLDFDDNDAYPYFMRTVPSDQLQAAAIVQIITNNSWDYVGIIASEGNYGGAGLSAFLTEASNKTYIAFQLRIDSQESRNLEVADNIIRTINETEIRVVVLFSSGDAAEKFFEAMHKKYEGLTDKDLREKIQRIVYIGSDSVASHSDLMRLSNTYLNTVFRQFIGIGVYMQEIEGFKDHLRQLSLNHYSDIYKRGTTNPSHDYMKEFIKSKKNSSEIVANIDPHSSSSSDATYAFGAGLARYITQRNITSSSQVDNVELYDVIKELNTTGLTNSVITFSNASTNVGKYTILEYDPVNRTLQEAGTFTSPDHLSYTHSYGIVSSICSEACVPGQWKNPTSPGCHECIACNMHQVSRNPNAPSCTDCPVTKTNNSIHTDCIEIEPTTIPYDGTFAITLYLLITAGLVGVIVTVVIFYTNFNTPVVQGHGVFIYITQLAMCVVLLASSVLFLGRPSSLVCDLQLAIPILATSTLFLCIICLTKTVILKVRAVKAAKFYFVQLGILMVGLLLQGAVILVVLLASPRQYKLEQQQQGGSEGVRVVLGNCGAKEANVALEGLLYLSLFLISITSLVLSFLGRNINENYSEGKFLVFQSIAMHIVLAAFVPTMLVLSGPTRSGAWAITSVILCYIVIIVLFIPKLYIIIYRPYKNKFTEELEPVKIGNGNS